MEGFGAHVDDGQSNKRSFIDEGQWNKRFEIPLKQYLDGLVDPCIRLFIGLEAEGMPVIDDNDDSEGETEKEAVDKGEVAHDVEKDQDNFLMSMDDGKLASDKERESLIEAVGKK